MEELSAMVKYENDAIHLERARQSTNGLTLLHPWNIGLLQQRDVQIGSASERE
jgi:hypothetical protein